MSKKSSVVGTYYGDADHAQEAAYEKNDIWGEERFVVVEFGEGFLVITKDQL